MLTTQFSIASYPLSDQPWPFCQSDIHPYNQKNHSDSIPATDHELDVLRQIVPQLPGFQLCADDADINIFEPLQIKKQNQFDQFRYVKKSDNACRFTIMTFN